MKNVQMKNHKTLIHVTLSKSIEQYKYGLEYLAISQGRPSEPPPPLKKDHLRKVVMNGAECSE